MPKIKQILCTLAAGLCVITANGIQAQAQMNSDPRSDFVTQLNESNISDFLAEVSAISTGQRPDMLDDDVVNYFTNHMAPKSKLKSQMRYEIPNFPTQENKMELDREQYISTIVKGRHMMEDYTSTVEIRDLKISGGGKQATFTSIITERGKMPFPKDPKKPDVVDIIPIEGESICAQKLAVSFNNFIQMAGADCQTVIRFDPFGGKPLIPE